MYLIISFMSSLPVESVLLASLPYSLSGGTHGLLMISFAYLAGTSKPGKYYCDKKGLNTFKIESKMYWPNVRLFRNAVGK